jgi:hypothetical protein
MLDPVYRKPRFVFLTKLGFNRSEKYGIRLGDDILRC